MLRSHRRRHGRRPRAWASAQSPVGEPSGAAVPHCRARPWASSGSSSPSGSRWRSGVTSPVGPLWPTTPTRSVRPTYARRRWRSRCGHTRSRGCASTRTRASGCRAPCPTALRRAGRWPTARGSIASCGNSPGRRSTSRPSNRPAALRRGPQRDDRHAGPSASPRRRAAYRARCSCSRWSARPSPSGSARPIPRRPGADERRHPGALDTAHPPARVDARAAGGGRPLRALTRGCPGGFTRSVGCDEPQGAGS